MQGSKYVHTGGIKPLNDLPKPDEVQFVSFRIWTHNLKVRMELYQPHEVRNKQFDYDNSADNNVTVGIFLLTSRLAGLRMQL